MDPGSPSRAVRAGYRLATGFQVLAIAFTLIALASIVVGLARGGESLLYGDRLSVPLKLSPQELEPLPPGLRLAGWPDVTADVRDPTVEQMLLRSAADLGPLLLFVAGLTLLRGFARSVRDGDPFGAPNVQRLRRLGFLLVIGAPLVELLNTSLRKALWEELPANRFGDVGVAGFTLPAGALIGGLGAFILAEVFAYGLQLREDVEATV